MLLFSDRHWWIGKIGYIGFKFLLPSVGVSDYQGMAASNAIGGLQRALLIRTKTPSREESVKRFDEPGRAGACFPRPSHALSLSLSWGRVDSSTEDR